LWQNGTIQVPRPDPINPHQDLTPLSFYLPVE
jgi:hypothetical protein